MTMTFDPTVRIAHNRADRDRYDGAPDDVIDAIDVARLTVALGDGEWITLTPSTDDPGTDLDDVGIDLDPDARRRLLDRLRAALDRLEHGG